MKDGTNQLVVFVLDDRRYALHLSSVERAVRVVDVTPLPKAPETVNGVVNIHGQVVPVFNMRKRFHLAEREINLGDQLIIAKTSKQTVALIADAVSGVIEIPGEEIITPEKILPGMNYVEGVVKLKDGMILIHDLDRFLSVDEEKALKGALENI